MKSSISIFTLQIISENYLHKLKLLIKMELMSPINSQMKLLMDIIAVIIVTDFLKEHILFM